MKKNEPANPVAITDIFTLAHGGAKA